MLNDVTILLLRSSLRGGGTDSPTKQSLGLVNAAQAIALWNWDGIMPGPAVSRTLVVYRLIDLLLILRVIMQLAFDCPRARS